MWLQLLRGASWGCTSLKAYLQRRLVQRASELLLTSEQTVRHIAEALGFADEFYFSRWFKRQVGVAPTRFREQARGG